MKISTKRLQYIISNEACQICGRMSKRVCNECLAMNQLACYCDIHQDLHKTDRCHMALWGELGQ